MTVKTFKINIQKIKMFILVITSVEMSVQSATEKYEKNFQKLKHTPTPNRASLNRGKVKEKDCNGKMNATFQLILSSMCHIKEKSATNCNRAVDKI